MTKPPAVAHLRQMGFIRLTVTYSAPVRRHAGKVTFEWAKIANDVLFPLLPGRAASLASLLQLAG